MNYIIFFLWFVVGLLAIKHLNDDTELVKEWENTFFLAKLLGVMIAPILLGFYLFFDVMSYDWKKMKNKK